MTEILTIQAIPAGGKTYAIIQHINNSMENKFIVVCIGQELARQTYNDIQRSKAIAITDDSGRTLPVTATIEKKLKAGIDVVLCCHQGFMRIAPSLLDGYTVIIDEIPAAIQLDGGTWNNTKDIDDILRRTTDSNLDDSKYTAHPDHGLAEIEAIREEQTRSDKIESMLVSLESGSTITRDKNNGFRWSVAFNWVSHLQYADKIYMLAAQIEGLATPLLMKAQGAVFTPCSDIKPNYSAYANPERIKVVPLLTGINYTKNKCIDSDRVLRIGSNGNYDKDGLTVYHAMRANAEQVVADYNKDGFTYTLNSYQASGSWGERDRMAYNPHGRNDLISYEAIVSIYQTNPNNSELQEIENLANLYEIDKEKLKQAYITQRYLEPVFQASTRGAIRNHSNPNTTYVVVVPDERAARYLLDGHFKGGELVMTYAIDGKKLEAEKDSYDRAISGVKLTPKGLGIPENLSNAFRSWKSRCARNQTPVTLKDCTKWMDKQGLQPTQTAAY
ncbi:hypothetical protein [Oceanisphaera sp. IT1-181]|uniref:hypothetical protein n=1 Tax=Oceanisphaera sp. IT1-181 TaxID=3081199 RepID=UPI0029CA5B88|nr:hypothetical protein [Oceanisphaera sp. IT1-181]